MITKLARTGGARVIGVLPRRMIVLAIAALGIAAVAGCASTGTSQMTESPVRAALDVPDYFVVGESEGTATTMPAPGTGCRSPMVDPRDGTRLTLVRSIEGVGDYEVAHWLYGVEPGEVLRIDCATGRAIGVFKRR